MIASRPPIRRFATIDNLIRAGKYPNARILSERMEVSERTILRDIEYMRDQLDAPIEYDYDRKGFYYSKSGFSLPSIRITEGELIALFLAEKVLKQYKGTPYEKELRSAYEKITTNLPEEISIDVQELDRMFSFRTTQTSRFEMETFRKLSEAVLKRKQIKMVYHSFSSDEVSEREVNPYYVGNIKRNWYLFEHCYLRKEVRMFTPGRIKKLEFTGKKVKIPSSFSSKGYLQSSFNVMKGKGKYKIKLKFDKSVANYICECVWHSSQKIQEHRDGSCTLALQLNSLYEIEHWILGWGPAVKVLSPAELVRRVSSKLRSAARAYSGSRKRSNESDS